MYFSLVHASTPFPILPELAIDMSSGKFVWQSITAVPERSVNNDMKFRYYYELHYFQLFELHGYYINDFQFNSRVFLQEFSLFI